MTSLLELQARRRAAIELFHDAMDAADVTYCERERGIVDSCSEVIVEALLDAGWIPPESQNHYQNEMDTK